MSAFQGGMNPNMNPMMQGMPGNMPGNMPPGMMPPGMMQNQQQTPPPLKYKKFNPAAKEPFKTYASDAGFDLCALEDGSISPGAFGVKVNTGIGLELPQGLFGLIRDRSSLASLGIIITGGVIDPDYRGEIQVILNNMGKEAFAFKSGDRIAQVIILPSGFFSFVETSVLDNSARGSGGFGSTGKSSPSPVNTSVNSAATPTT